MATTSTSPPPRSRTSSRRRPSSFRRMRLQRSRCCRCHRGRGGSDLRARPRRTPGCPMSISLYAEVLIQGVLTGLVYGLMALGLSVIFGVVRVVNFAHGEMMTIAAVIFAFGYLLQKGLINRFVTRPEHTQFLLLIAVAIIIVNVLLIVFGPDARTVQVAYAFDSFQLGPLIVDASKVYAGAAAIVFAALLF